MAAHDALRTILPAVTGTPGPVGGGVGVSAAGAELPATRGIAATAVNARTAPAAIATFLMPATP